MKAILWLLLALCVMVGCTRPTVVAQAEGDPEAETAKDFTAGQEARVWLQDPNHTMFEISKQDAVNLVDQLYKAGAPKVVMADAFALAEGGLNEVGATFIIELPTDSAKRKKVFDVEKRWEEYQGGEGSDDSGQKYLVIATD